MIFLLLLPIFLRGASSSFPVDQPVTFSFSSFNPRSCSDGSLICMGATTATYGYLSLTSDPSPESPEVPLNKVGRVLYSKPVTAWPAMISTAFTVRILPYPNTNGSADGMTFVLAPDSSPSPEGSVAGNLGLTTSSTNASLLAVELDTYRNAFDPDDNHIGIDIASLISDPAESLDSFDIDLKSGRPIQVEIYYDGWAKILHVYAAYAGNPLRKLIEKPIIMSATVPTSVYVGFTAATGPYFGESHQVLDWNFTTFPLPNSSLEMQNLAIPM